jgi:2-polyprenyl-3-methyl-5-hydroxy-6-metoxy-1,4-benzoquinol methylase
MRVYSPLLETETECRHIRSVDTELIRQGYIREYGYDPKFEFSGVDKLSLFECLETSLKFFAPLSTAGREALYHQLQTFDWNYKETKWEHDESLKLLSENARLLDVGCGRAAFLNRAAADKAAKATGLEFNKSAAEYGRERGIEIFTDTIEAHAELRPNYYDFVASFQVLEHVTKPASFLRACVKALKPGGELIIGVPNNDGFLGLQEYNWLNMPPHHMSLWGKACLENLAKLLSIEHISTYIEPLQEKEWFKGTLENAFLTGRLKRSLYYRLGFDEVLKKYIDSSWQSIPGHTIMVRFKKPKLI